jgi:hypothetical protein
MEDKKGKNMFNTNNKKINRSYTIDKVIAERFKQTADKDMRKMSQIVETSIRRYIDSKTS